MNQNYEIGVLGEKLASKYLQEIGYKIIDRNFICKQGEIDIIAQDKNEKVFIEVKTRSNLNYGTPATAVNYIKKKHIKCAAKIFLTLNNIKNCCIRFDVVEVFIKDGRCKINHIKQIM